MRRFFEWISFIFNMLLGLLMIVAGLAKILLAGVVLFVILYLLYSVF